MRGKIDVLGVLFVLLLTWVSCNQRNAGGGGDVSDTLTVGDTLMADTMEYAEDDDGLSLENRETEVFGDFIFAFTHNTRFQAERIRFPLPVRDASGEERVIRSGRQFRSEFQLPGNDYYTLLLGELGQMAVFQSDTALTDVAFQCIRLGDLSMSCYNFARSEGRWYLTSRTDGPLVPELDEFFRFYGRFVADSVFQQERLSPRLTITIPRDEEAEEDEEELEGTIDPDQWPVFRPEMPGEEFVNIYFGQPYPSHNHLYLLQCGISNGMLDVFSFRREDGRWMLTSYEN